MRARLATIFTLLVLVGGTGGAIAAASGSGSNPETGGSAAASQYNNGKHCGQHKTDPKTCPKPNDHSNPNPR